MSQDSNDFAHPNGVLIKKEPKILSNKEDSINNSFYDESKNFICEHALTKTKKRKIKKEKDSIPAKIKNEKSIIVEIEYPKAEQKKTKKQKKEEPEQWKWWEETPLPQGVHWLTLEHNGPIFAPIYEPLPPDIKFIYDGKPLNLSNASEEIAYFYAKMLDSDYTKQSIFNSNFFNDWRHRMTADEKKVIIDFNKCDFTKMFEYYKEQHAIQKARSKDEKLKIKEENQKIMEIYGFCKIDGHLQKVGNYRTEPPGLFRGRGDHPKQGKIKDRIMPEDITINISDGSKVPDPPHGHSWKAVIHDNKVTWLATWVENISGLNKYIMLNPTAKVKGSKDMAKYDIARGLHNCIDTIRHNYLTDMSSKEMKIRQRAVAIYFIDRLALRAGHEKEDGESADTVGCCSLRVEHIKLSKDYNNKKYLVDFDFLGKDSVRYINQVAIEKKVYKNLLLFMKDKKPESDLFDRLTTSSLNKYLGKLMEGLTAKFFRTYNASTTLQDQLNKLTEEKSNLHDKLLTYNRANRAVAILCNHQRSIPKTFNKTMENLSERIKSKKKEVKTCKKELKTLKKEKGIPEQKITVKKTKLKRLKDQLHGLKNIITDKEENKQIALGTSKLNYLDPRISVAWCRKHNVPIEKIYNKTHREKFQWAIDMTDSEFVF